MTLRTVVVGLGWWGRHLVAKLEASDRFEVAGTVDADPDQGADHQSLETGLADPTVDAVVLCIPHSAHHDAIVACAEAGKHVFCEKPLTLTAADARRAVDACARAGVTLGVGHERRFDDTWAALATMVHGGELGTPLHAEAAMSHDKFRGLPATHWRGSAAEAPAAGMTGMGIHLTDALIWLLGPVAEVQAWVDRRILELPSGDVVSAHLRFRDGAVGVVSAVSATLYYGRLAVFGSEAWVEVRDDDHPETGLGGTLTTCRRDGAPSARHVDAVTDSVLANLEAFADAVVGAAPYPFTADHLVHNIEVLEAIVASAAAGGAVVAVSEPEVPHAN